MDKTEDQSPQTLIHCYNSSLEKQFVKKATKFLLSVSLFSLCFSHSSLLSFLHSSNFYFFTFPYQLFTHRIDKNCIFLICNLLLVFLAKHSGLIRSMSRSYHITDHETSFKNTARGPEFESPMLETEEELVLLNEDILVENMGSVENGAPREEEEGEEESEFLINRVEEDAEKTAEECREQEQEPEIGSIVSDEAAEDNGKLSQADEDGNGKFSSSTEDLNKKFEDFIRKMKEELRIEAQRQLIMV